MEDSEKISLKEAVPQANGCYESSKKSKSRNLNLKVEDNEERKFGLLDLPDLVLLHVASFLTQPEDLLKFGSTCRRLKSISYGDKFWFIIGMQLLTGIWPYVKTSVSGKTCREWVLSFYNSVSPKPSQKAECFDFGNGEVWNEVKYKKLDILFHILQMAYSFEEYEHKILFLNPQCLPRIVFFHRKPAIEFHQCGSISGELKTKLLGIGIKDEEIFHGGGLYEEDMEVGKVSKNWDDLFLSNEFGSISPLLVNRYEKGLGEKYSGFSGLLICFSLVLEKYVITYRKSNVISLEDVAAFMKAAAESFAVFMQHDSHNWKSEYGEFYLIPAINFMATTRNYNTSDWQASLNKLQIPLDSKILLKELHDTIRENGGIDCIADKVRHRWRQEVTKFLKGFIMSYENEQGSISRINLTDNLKMDGSGTDTICSAAFILNNCVVVIRHLGIEIRNLMLLM